MFHHYRDTIGFGGSITTPICTFRYGSHARTLGWLTVCMMAGKYAIGHDRQGFYIRVLE